MLASGHVGWARLAAIDAPQRTAGHGSVADPVDEIFPIDAPRRRDFLSRPLNAAGKASLARHELRAASPLQPRSAAILAQKISF